MSIRTNIAAAVKAVEKQFGKGTIMALGEGEQESIEVFPSGSYALDRALGIGGIPRGRIIEVYGPESSGKTTLALHIIARAQQAGVAAAFIDAEHALDIFYARKLGVNVEELMLSQPDCGEQALDIAVTLAGAKGVGLIVVDSVAALVPRAEIEGDMGDQHVGRQARLMSQAMRKLTAICARSNTTILFINQIRHKIGVMFGSPETTTGGHALKFYCSVRVEIRRTGSIKHGEALIGNKVRIKVVKNKLAPPFLQAETEIIFGRGIDALGELIDMGVTDGIIDKAGSWYSYNDERIGQGKEQAKVFLREHEQTRQKIETALLAPEGAVPEQN
jgi:recombination protein RecA